MDEFDSAVAGNDGNELVCVGDQESTSRPVTAIGTRSGIPMSYIQLGNEIEFKRLKERIVKRFVGQSHVIVPIMASIQQFMVGLSNPMKPIGSFLLVGSSGLATDFAKVLVNELFHDEKFLITIDMINYYDESSISNFLGAPGYADKVTEEVRRRPFSILLFERIVKGATNVLNLLVSVTSSGSLIDVMGRKIDFSNTIVLMTTNTDSHVQEDCETISFEQFRNTVVQKVQTHLDDKLLKEVQILVFDKPSLEHLKNILEEKILVISEMLKAQGLQLEMAPCAIDSILAKIPKPINVKALEKWLDDDFKMVLAKKILGMGMPPFSKIIVGVTSDGVLKYDVE